MKTYESENIRNIVLAGHASKGKTTLAEALLNVAGATERLGKVADGTTVTDYDSEEKKRHISVSSAVAPDTILFFIKSEMKSLGLFKSPFITASKA